MPEKFLKLLNEIDGLYEIGIEYQSNIYRIFCRFDKGKLVFLLNDFHKKTQKFQQNLENQKTIVYLYYTSCIILFDYDKKHTT